MRSKYEILKTLIEKENFIDEYFNKAILLFKENFSNFLEAQDKNTINIENKNIKKITDEYGNNLIQCTFECSVIILNNKIKLNEKIIVSAYTKDLLSDNSFDLNKMQVKANDGKSILCDFSKANYLYEILFNSLVKETNKYSLPI